MKPWSGDERRRRIGRLEERVLDAQAQPEEGGWVDRRGCGRTDRCRATSTGSARRSRRCRRSTRSRARIPVPSCRGPCASACRAGTARRTARARGWPARAGRSSRPRPRHRSSCSGDNGPGSSRHDVGNGRARAASTSAGSRSSRSDEALGPPTVGGAAHVADELGQLGLARPARPGVVAVDAHLGQQVRLAGTVHEDQGAVGGLLGGPRRGGAPARRRSAGRCGRSAPSASTVIVKSRYGRRSTVTVTSRRIGAGRRSTRRSCAPRSGPTAGPAARSGRTTPRRR